ncbi:MAG: hypothetical protein IPP25_19585 [Saprospiraceae bacterium]|nr:hypothetical protein [Candidatus Opimibacter skivensis]
MVDDYDYAILGLAHTLTILKEFEAAIKLYNSLIANEPENPRAYNGRANVYRLMNDFDQALLDVYKALELDPNYGTAFATFAEINAHKNNLNEFYLNFENAIRLNKESIEYSLKEEDVYKPFFKDDRFLKIIDKYNLSVE